ncbi:MAG TPA: hypothetical protein VET23_12570, partial [Chitinophagaceae bacterium]|nr:hypothetical protein [Chitinophagaceae bacterium]
MRITIISFFCILSIPIFAQQDTILTYLDFTGKICPEQKAVSYAVQFLERGRWKKETFDIADDKIQQIAYYKDSACTYLDGPFRTYYKSQNIQTAGQYVENKKNGIWKSWSENKNLVDSAFYKDGWVQGLELMWNNEGNVTDSLIFEENGNGIKRGYWEKGVFKETGTFVEGKKQGLWTYYYPNGNKSQEVNYDGDSAISYTCYDLQGNLQTKDCYYEKEAEFKGGDNAWSNWLIKKLSSLQLPKAYLNGTVYGTVYVQFVVDADGNVTSVKVIKS